MQLKNSYKPNYFFFAQRFMHLLQQYIQQHPEQTELAIPLQDIYRHFGEDFAASSTSLDGILNIADEYHIETLDGDQKIIQSYRIDAIEHVLQIKVIADVTLPSNFSIKWREPDANSYE